MSNVFIIAEAGVNHNGDIELAKKLVDIAAEAGVDAVKFQTWRTELLVTKDSPQAEYQTLNTGVKESQFDMLKRLELSFDDFRELKKYCDSKSILFLSTPDDFESATFLNDLQDIFKVGSAELTNYPFLRHIASFGKPMILSTGMATMDEIAQAIQWLNEEGITSEKLTILHCTTNYPTPFDQVNLKAMQTIKQVFNVKVGYSDHTLGIEVPIAAVAIGAELIEKHFTIDKAMQGPDHIASLSPIELNLMVAGIRNVEKCLGDGIKKPFAIELENKKVVRKIIVALRDINKGDLLSSDNMCLKRSNGFGVEPENWIKLDGKAASKAYLKDEAILL